MVYDYSPAGPSGHAMVDRWNAQLNAIAPQYKVPPNLAKAHMLYESGGNPNALGYTGRGIGLMQIDYGTQKVDGVWVYTGPTPVPLSLWDPGSNIRVACADFLSENVAAFPTNLDACIAAYNAGIAAVQKALAAGTDLTTVTTDPKYIANVKSAYAFFTAQAHMKPHPIVAAVQKAASQAVQSLHVPAPVTIAGGVAAVAGAVAGLDPQAVVAHIPGVTAAMAPTIHAVAATVSSVGAAIAVVGRSPIQPPTSPVPQTLQLQKEPPNNMDLKALAGPMADMLVAEYESAAVKAAIEAEIGSLESQAVPLVAAELKKLPKAGWMALASNAVDGMLENVAAKLVAQYGPTIIYAFGDKELKEFAAQLGG